ncbi:MAG TPA: heparinase II/III family protein [Gemmatimonadaceae bacterium]|nr:heparinase II/III family protein [Gemmatimonadaceae bacterium]
MLLLSPEDLEARRIVAAEPLRPLADSLAADLAPVLAREVYVPEHKALLSRAGGRCERDGTMLEFDPFSPREHRCAQCGAVYTAEIHHRWWIYPYQLWLAERAVHASVLHAMRGEAPYASLARDILRKYCDVYHTYANRDNALGPTRPFFSTYLESIWLLQVCVATSLLEHAGEQALADDVRARVVQPSVALITGFDEGLSNRQVWNNAAMMAAALLLDDRRGIERVVRASSGVETHLRECLLADGTWYEGDNYHQFAHRGLWYCVTLAQQAGVTFAPDLLRRFDDGFAASFATALPDFTFPARKDSQYAVSLRQWRFAESCELGLARRDDPRLRAALARLYADDIPRGDTGRARSSAEAERNVAASRLSRADLGWRSLLFASAQLPELANDTPRSVHLPAQGYTVFRRDSGRVYVALDWGQSGGGHGHPDRLNVLFADGATRWLDDLGTGSYVEQSLHWYRSTLAHNAPLVNGRSQARVNGKVLAYDERGGVGWILASADEIAPGVAMTRAIVVTPDYFVDELRWSAPGNVRVELPIHLDGDVQNLHFASQLLDGGDGTEDGFGFVRDAECAEVKAGAPLEVSAARNGKTLRAVSHVDCSAQLFRAHAPGQPSSVDARFHLIRCHAASGAIRSVWAWNDRVNDVQFVDDTIAVTMGNERHVHRQTPEYWQVEMTAGAAHSGIELYGWTEDETTRGREDETRATAQPTPERTRVLQRGSPLDWQLGEAHYRRSESSWGEAGKPTAHVRVHAMNDELIIDVTATVGPLVRLTKDAVNTLDNENADINVHGVQLYVHTRGKSGGWVIAVSETENAHVRQLTEWGALELRSVDFTPRDRGFGMQFRVPIPRGRQPVAFDVIVNDTTSIRARRRGQLVLSGAHGEFVYLRGDRHDPARLIPLLVDD